MTIKEVFDEYLLKSDEELLKLAKEATSILKQYHKVEKHMNMQQSYSAICDFWKLYVSADQSVSKSEFYLFLNVFGFEEESFSFIQFQQITNGGIHPLYISQMKAVINSLPENVKTACLYLGIIICVIDRDVSHSEIGLIENLLN